MSPATMIRNSLKEKRQEEITDDILSGDMDAAALERIQEKIEDIFSIANKTKRLDKIEDTTLQDIVREVSEEMAQEYEDSGSLDADAANEDPSEYLPDDF